MGPDLTALRNSLAELKNQQTPANYLSRSMEAHFVPPTVSDELLADFITFQATNLPREYLSPLNRDPERDRLVTSNTERWLEIQQEHHPRGELGATPQMVRYFVGLAGLGILEPLMADPEVTEIIVESTNSILVEKGGQTIPEQLRFPSDEALRRQAIALCALSGRNISYDHPFQTFGLTDGSRAVVIIAPAACRSPALINIRRKKSTSFRLLDLIDRQALSLELAQYLEQAVRAWANIIVTGESGCGKTTVLEALLSAVSSSDRGMIIQENDELHPSHPHMRYILASPDLTDKGISLGTATRFSMLTAPRRLIVGEAKEGEAATLLFAITAGFSGCMTTIHSFPGADALNRLYIASLMDPEHRYGEGGQVLRETIVSAIDVIIHVAFSPQGHRHIDQIDEVWGLNTNGQWDTRTTWQAQYQYDLDDQEQITWAQTADYKPAPRLAHRLDTYRGRLAMETRGLPESPLVRADRLHRTYTEAVTLGEQGLFNRALQILEPLQTEAGPYRDVDSLIKDYHAREQQQQHKHNARVAGLLQALSGASPDTDRGTSNWLLEELAEIDPARATTERARLAAATTTKEVTI